MVKGYADLGDFKENDRCRLIAETLKKHPANSEKPLVVGIVVETDEKADRYLQKIIALCPGAKEIGRFKGPAAGMITFKVQSPTQ